MDRWLIVGLVVCVAVAFTVACTVAGGPVCALLIWPGLAITDHWLVPNPLGHLEAAWSMSIAINTLIYSGLFGLIVRLLRPFLWE